MNDLLDRIHRFRQSDGWIFGYMLFSSLVSLTASFVLSVDAIELAKNPDAILSCDINSVISCGTVGTTWQANLLGFPNAFLGLIAEPVVITIAVASLAKVRFPRGFMLAAQVVYTIGFLFAYWLFYQSMFHINALCPWCLLVTLSTTLVFSSLTHVNIRDNNLFLPARVQTVLASGLRMGLDALIVVVWLTLIVVSILVKYGAALFA
ncbi:vitamin K epoxide reductase family protein [Brooklawnia cerclae]|uniref:Membrane protein n=1 Tax=Brooklawnia cerclae TaxID=349934 RepID=A0ABX0SH66_9ACTN|nr:vitamin K epoxide reductase family protein [Brooklawnia cerclae]NIH56663.1 putative membrane protein [Brooklawnia cerclae]